MIFIIALVFTFIINKKNCQQFYPCKKGLNLIEQNVRHHNSYAIKVHRKRRNVTVTITSKINVTSKGAYLPISKLHSILIAANLLAHNNISQICCCGQILLQSAADNCIFPDNLTPSGVTFNVIFFGWVWYISIYKETNDMIRYS